MTAHDGRGDRRAKVRVIALAALLVAGCATTEKQLYVDWIAVANPAEVCGGQSDCIQHSTYKGKAMCTIVTADKGVSYARLGEQFRDCLK